MELRHLQYFVTVAEEQSFTRAAARLHVVQSGVSATVRALERELGSALFDRSGKRVVLTAAGHALLPEARAALAAVRAGESAVRASCGGLSGTLDVGAITAALLIDFPALVGAFHAQWPDVAIRLRLSSTGSAGLAQSLLAGELDVAFLSVVRRLPAGLTARPLASYPLVLLVPDGHRLAGRRQVRLHELAEEPFVDFPLGSGLRDLADTVFAGAGVRRRVTVESADLASTAAFVGHGLGLALVPEFAARDAPGTRPVRPADQVPDWTLSVATSSRRPPTAELRALLDLTDTHRPTQPTP
ncbi:LysR family transcriptional regulator [Amycolatopsis sp. FDAARGOS 1241]|uniref:LysR family transcriptional regulator n=1 Tax=Amycolatopsis sp. FDAARGOS 1241 TaxID=2778070 RepID=UPI00194F1F50|nr:LysR family transcriptional regulator [Amycolatopsis sp. FDAARGOS 1241]QRP44921.1 LysR family transcriptional regulator [Amycolatopsis sp. FDAARGOS 1241]